MRDLFYNITEAITERITGITNGEIRIWEFDYWMDTQEKVQLILNIVIFTLIISLICDICNYVKKYKEA